MLSVGWTVKHSNSYVLPLSKFVIQVGGVKTHSNLLINLSYTNDAYWPNSTSFGTSGTLSEAWGGVRKPIIPESQVLTVHITDRQKYSLFTSEAQVLTIHITDRSTNRSHHRQTSLWILCNHWLHHLEICSMTGCHSPVQTIELAILKYKEWSHLDCALGYFILSAHFSLNKQPSSLSTLWSYLATDGPSWTAMYHYRPQTKLREGNVSTPVCDSVHRGRSLSRGVSVQWGSLSNGGLCPMGVSV